MCFIYWDSTYKKSFLGPNGGLSETYLDELIIVQSQLPESSSTMVQDDSEDVRVLSQPFPHPPPRQGEWKRKAPWKLESPSKIRWAVKERK